MDNDLVLIDEENILNNDSINDIANNSNNLNEKLCSYRENLLLQVDDTTYKADSSLWYWKYFFRVKSSNANLTKIEKKQLQLCPAKVCRYCDLI